MSVAQAIVAFGVSWWLVLLIILPIGFKPDSNPTVGHAPSSPKSFDLKRKIKMTTLIACMITVAMYQFFAFNAQAETYQSGADCAPIQPHKPSDDVHVKDGHGVHGSRVRGANFGKSHIIDKSLRYIDVPLELPVTDFIDETRVNPNLAVTNVRPGTVTLDREDNSVRFNGVSLSDAPLYNPDCISKKDSDIYSTK